MDLTTKSYDELSRLAIRTGCETELNRQADLEFKRRGYEFLAPLQMWVLRMELDPNDPRIRRGDQ